MCKKTETHQRVSVFFLPRVVCGAAFVYPLAVEATFTGTRTGRTGSAFFT